MKTLLFPLLLLLPFQEGEEKRKTFLEGSSAQEASTLVLTGEKENIDAVAAFFTNREKPYRQRLLALKALRLLKKKAPQEYKRVYPVVQTHLSLEASRGHALSSLKKEEEEMLLEALQWHADMKYEHAMYVLEHYVDTEINRMRRNKLPARVRESAAKLLSQYPKNVSAADTLWDTLVESREKESLRKACYDALKTHMKNRDQAVLEWKVEAKDRWLQKVQQKLREK
ncbi:MAG: hypothetical protein QF645_08265 [Planctomycetota bacterium]|nr:hypothetical protein [Planctomycetota bacterium]